MSDPTQQLFRKINERRRTEGRELLRWDDFRKKRAPTTGRIRDTRIDPDPPSQLTRPKATYDNQSIRHKYGLE